jgi:hypothetical protein
MVLAVAMAGVHITIIMADIMEVVTGNLVLGLKTANGQSGFRLPVLFYRTII